MTCCNIPIDEQPKFQTLSSYMCYFCRACRRDIPNTINSLKTSIVELRNETKTVTNTLAPIVTPESRVPTVTQHLVPINPNASSYPPPPD